MKKYEDFISEPRQNIFDYVENQLRTKGSNYQNIIKDLEAVIRNTPEYKLWAIRHKVGIDKCQICGIEFNKKIKPEVHHTPLTLYEIVQNVLDDIISSGKKVSTLNIIEQVLQWHEDEKIGSLTICNCCHKQLHYEKEKFGEEITIRKVIDEK